jgi:hypothetical protein
MGILIKCKQEGARIRVKVLNPWMDGVAAERP